MATFQQIREPKTLAVAATLLVVGTVAGFFLGRLTAPQSTALGSTAPVHKSSRYPNEDLEADSDHEGEEDLQTYTDRREECKLVLVVRTDLGMTKGKIAAQCSHATLACYKALLRQEAKTNSSNSILRRWEGLGQAKVSVRVNSEEELLLIQAQALSLGLCAKVIHDAGRTQIASGSATVLGVGPGPKSVVDQVTGGLKLL